MFVDCRRLSDKPFSLYPSLYPLLENSTSNYHDDPLQCVVYFLETWNINYKILLRRNIPRDIQFDQLQICGTIGQVSNICYKQCIL